MTFESIFTSWLAVATKPPISDEVKAFAFNLYEPAGKPNVKFGIELIGAGHFNEDDPDWPCDEIWEPQPRGIDIPVSYSGTDWESCLDKMKTLVATLLSKNDAVALKLKVVEGIGIGFVDGDLEIVWMP